MQQGCPIEMSVLNNRMSSFGFGRRRFLVGGAPSESVADDEKRMELKGVCQQCHRVFSVDRR
jgi:hypothetical protein